MSKSFLILVAMAFFGLSAVGSGFNAMLMYWWYAIFRPHDLIWIDISAFRLPLLAGMLFAVYSVITKHWPSFDNAIHRLIGVFAVITVISQITSACESIYALSFDHVLILCVLVLFTARYLVSIAKIVSLTLLISIFFAVHSATLGLDILISGGTLYDADVGSGGITGSNAVALASAMTILLLFPMLPVLWKGNNHLLIPFLNKKPIRLILLVLVIYDMVGMLGFIYGSDSRGSALAFVAGCLVWMALHRRPALMSFYALCLLIFSITFNLIPDSYYERISSAFVESEELDDSAASRPHFWGVGLTMAKYNIAGVGIGCYLGQYYNYDRTEGQYGDLMSIHSSFFNVLAELGFVGMLTWLLLNYYTYRFLFLARRTFKFAFIRCSNLENTTKFMFTNSLIASHSIFVIGGQFYEFSYNDITWLTFVMAAALYRITNEEVTSGGLAKDLNKPA